MVQRVKGRDTRLVVDGVEVPVVASYFGIDLAMGPDETAFYVGLGERRSVVFRVSRGIFDDLREGVAWCTVEKGRSLARFADDGGRVPDGEA